MHIGFYVLSHLLVRRFVRCRTFSMTDDSWVDWRLHSQLSVVRGSLWCLYSNFEFILCWLDKLFIWIASDNWRSRGLFLYICVTFISKSGGCLFLLGDMFYCDATWQNCLFCLCNLFGVLYLGCWHCVTFLQYIVRGIYCMRECR